MLRLIGLTCALLAVLWLAGTAQSPDQNDRRLDRLESARLDPRISAIEARIDNVEKLNIGIFIVVVTQLIANVVQGRGANRR